MLKVVSILMIVFASLGIVGLVLAALGLTFIHMVGNILPPEAGAAAEQVSQASLYVMPVIGCAVLLTTGIVGARFCHDRGKANLCLVFGIAAAAVSVIGEFVNWIPGTPFPVDSLIWGLILPVLYIIGAARNRAS